MSRSPQCEGRRFSHTWWHLTAHKFEEFDIEIIPPACPSPSTIKHYSVSTISIQHIKFTKIYLCFWEGTGTYAIAHHNLILRSLVLTWRQNYLKCWVKFIFVLKYFFEATEGNWALRKLPVHANLPWSIAIPIVVLVVLSHSSVQYSYPSYVFFWTLFFH